MIKTFRSRVAEDIYHGINSQHARKLPKILQNKARRLFDQLNSITRIDTLKIPPGNHLEKLKGALSGYWSIRINQQWRIIFQWNEFDAYLVDIIDYH